MLWIGFLAFVLVMLAIDLGVFNRSPHAMSMREASIWSAVWVALALGFAGLVYSWFGPRAATEFLTGYVIEKSLSVDNLFVFVVVFGALGIPPLYQRRVLFWGILSALVLRGGMILVGIELIARFHWLLYVFGGFLVVTGVKLIRTWKNGDEESLEDGAIFRFVRRVLPSTTSLHGGRFVAVEEGRRVATPLLVALVLIEITDVVFALDSIPAVVAVTRDPFLVFTSNVFAILGLRSLFFLLAGALQRFHDLKLGLAAVLVFVGAKMTLADVVEITPFTSLVIVAALLALPIPLALWRRARLKAPPAAAEPGELEPAPATASVETR